MELKEQIELIILNDDYYGTSEKQVDAILSLPSGMGKVSTCSHCTEGYIGSEWEHITCPTCHGSGEIVTDLTLGEIFTDLTLGEAIEWAKWISDTNEIDVIPNYKGYQVRVKK